MTVSFTRTDLFERSKCVILAGQTSEGAYLAAPTFPTYRYSWFRDGAFIADAMDAVGESASAAAFHRWAASVLDAELTPSGDVTRGGILHTRYLPNGRIADDDWPNFQLDGFGTWLWAYERHVVANGKRIGALEATVVERLALYLLNRWSLPNFDCWEEHQDRVHPSTLGAIYAGLRAAGRLVEDPGLLGAAEAIRSYILAHAVKDGRFVKHVGSSEVDANLLWLAVTYDVVPADSQLMTATLAKVATDIQDVAGGVHRYARDTYYGGGAWPLLTADLAQVRLARGESVEALRLLSWIEAQAGPNGDLPEQVQDHANDPSYIGEWRERWGESACPLLWSHAAYLRLLVALESHGVEVAR